MDSLPVLLEQWLPVYGPWLLFTLAVLETCFVTGLVVPSGLATSIATVLALQAQAPLAPVIGAAVAGGWVGDALGFWVGRWTGARVLHGDGPFARAVSRRHRTLSRFFGRHPVYSVTVARWVSFVRTLMPMAAGMSGLRFSTYLLYEAPGLVGWAALYVGVGLLAGESWEAATRLVGVGGAGAFAVGGLALWIALRIRRARGGGEEAGPEEAVAGLVPEPSPAGVGDEVAGGPSDPEEPC